MTKAGSAHMYNYLSWRIHVVGLGHVPCEYREFFYGLVANNFFFPC